MHCSTQPRQLQLQREEPASICSYQRLRSVSANRQNKTKPRNNNHDNKNATEPLRTKTSPQKKQKKHHSQHIPTECFYGATELWRRRRASYLFDVSDKVVQRVGRSVSLWGKNTRMKPRDGGINVSYESLVKTELETFDEPLVFLFELRLNPCVITVL